MSWRHQVVATKWGPSGAAWLFDRLVNKAGLMTRYSVQSAGMVGDRVRSARIRAQRLRAKAARRN
jgi:hypothetical protein